MKLGQNTGDGGMRRRIVPEASKTERNLDSDDVKSQEINPSVFMKQSLRSKLFEFLSLNDMKLIGVLTLLAVLVRMSILKSPPVVVFDEVHFGGMAAKYLRGEFYFDVHPPLARLLVTLSAWLSGFKGDFNFHDIGVDYRRHGIPYVGMRAFSAVFGVATIPMAFVTLRALGGSSVAAGCAALMVLFESALTTQSRLILLDSYLIFFTAASILGWSLFRREEVGGRAFSATGLASLLATGVALGGAISCKWVGLFTMGAVGIQVIQGLWGMWCLPSRFSLKLIGKHFVVRALTLIAVPAMIYVASFWVHFTLLPGFSPSAASFTLQFQQNFPEAATAPTNGPVYFGSTITLRQDRRDHPGWLHSHEALYPAGTRQQQVTVYHHHDSNNQFILKRPYLVNVTYTAADLEEPLEEEELVELRHGDQVRLLHVNTGRYLHSHHEPAPLSTKKEHHAEVSCYGHELSRFSDLNDNWIVYIAGSNGESLARPSKREDAPKINALQHRLIFLHPLAACVLHSSNKILPDWGFRQAEVTCGREVLKGHTHWVIDSNEHPLHFEDENNFRVEQRKAGFWERFVEVHGRMWVVNAGLTSSHYFESRPLDWFFLRRGLGFWGGRQVPRSEGEIAAERGEKNPKEVNDATRLKVSEADREAHRESYKEQQKEFKRNQVYLFGNVVTWPLTSAALLTALGLLSLSIITWQRIRHAPGFGWVRECCGRVFSLADPQGPLGYLFLSWLLHFIPFFGMKRQLFLHHYLPALYCGILFMASVLDVSTSKSSRRTLIFVALASTACAAFFLYSPLIYGTAFSLCRVLKLRKTWDWDCSFMDE